MRSKLAIEILQFDNNHHNLYSANKSFEMSKTNGKESVFNHLNTFIETSI